ncbi:unnamed protein product [Rhodiola kirilowii]
MSEYRDLRPRPVTEEFQAAPSNQRTSRASKVCVPPSRWEYTDKHCQCSYCRPTFLHPGIAFDEQDEYSSSIPHCSSNAASAPISTCSCSSTPPAVVEKPLADLSSDESEMESSDEDMDRKPSLMKPAKKRMKTESIVGPAVDKDVAHETVGLRPATLVPKEMPMIKKKNPIKITQKPVQNDQKDEHTSDAPEETETEKECPAPKPFASAEDLESGKLPPEEILSLPMFKNYSAGNPAPVLYIKNLSKDVVPSDFYFLFGSLFGDLEMIKSSVTVKLMQEGRMRGQAFVTFPSTELAHQALNLANGYVFKSKPMIIQFGRNPATTRNS